MLTHLLAFFLVLALLLTKQMNYDMLSLYA